MRRALKGCASPQQSRPWWRRRTWTPAGQPCWRRSRIATLAAVAVLILCMAGLVRNAAALAFRALVELVLPCGDALVFVAVVAVAALMLLPLIDNPTGNTLSTADVLVLFQGPLLALVRFALALACVFFVVWIAGAIASTVIRAEAQVEPGTFMRTCIILLRIGLL